MFTGIVQEIGRLKARKSTGNKYQLTIEGSEVLKNASKGDSIAVNGVCLTVVRFSENSFTADVMPETLKSTNLNDLKKGDEVNLEQAVQPDGFFGGHLVTGHVDGRGKVKNIRSEKNARIVEITVSEDLLEYMVDKGSIALNGVSLTIVKVKEKSFTVSLIPETWSNTTFKNLKIGDEINIETDLLGKYVVKMMKRMQSDDSSESGIDKNFLSQNGFL